MGFLFLGVFGFDDLHWFMLVLAALSCYSVVGFRSFLWFWRTGFKKFEEFCEIEFG